MKKLVVLFIFILFLGGVCAVRINEVEMNSLEGKEWIELYNDGEEVDISGWEIWEGIYGSSGPKIIITIPNGIIIANNEFYIIKWEGTKLNNDGDFVTLYDSAGNKIDETKTLKDSYKNDKTWQLCGIWEFKESTKGEKNDCVKIDEKPSKTDKEEEKEEENNETPDIIEDNDVQDNQAETSSYSYQTPIQSEVIKLNTKSIKSKNNTEDKDKSVYAKYGFTIFCVLLGTLFILKKKKHKKNEFGR